MWRRIFGFGFVLAVLLAEVIFPPLHASAQNTPAALNLSTSPLPIGLKAKPGQTVSTDLRVKNGGTAPEALTVTLLKFTANNDEGQPRLAERGPGDTYFDWVSFSEKSFTAEPNVWKTIKMTIKVPANAGLGYYYAPVFSRASNAQAESGASIAGGAASLVLLDVDSPQARREMQIAEFTSKKRVYEFLPASFTVKISNTGNLHGIPSGNIFISKGNQQLAALDINGDHGNVLPTSSRNFTAAWADGFPAYQEKTVDGKIVNGKHGEAAMELKWNFANASKLRFGRYTATALVVYDDGQKDVPLEATLSFWVIPWRIIGAILLVILVVGVGIWTVLRKLWKGARRLGGKKKTGHGEAKD